MWLTHRVKNREIHVGLTALTRRHSTNHLRAILDGLFTMEGSLFACESLANDPRIGGQDQILACGIVAAVASHRGY